MVRSTIEVYTEDPFIHPIAELANLDELGE